MDLGTTLSLLAVLAVGLVLGAALGVLLTHRRGGDPGLSQRRAVAEAATRAADAAVVRDSLDRLHDQLRDMAQHGVSWQSQLKQQVDDVRHSTDVLRRETSSLSTALRKPQVRGRWGELHLRRAVELAGLVDRCDFAEQVTAARRGRPAPPRPGGAPGRRQARRGRREGAARRVPRRVTVDPDDDGRERDAHLSRHARQLRQHVDALAAKSYWRALPSTPEFVVLFVPGESFLSAALEAEPSLLEYAADQQVVLATPTTLIALLRTVAYAWTQQALADKAREIHQLGRDLHDRLATMSGHLDQARPVPHRSGQRLQPGGRLAGEPGAGLGPPLQRPRRRRGRARHARAGDESPAPAHRCRAARRGRLARAVGPSCRRLDQRPEEGSPPVAARRAFDASRHALRCTVADRQREQHAHAPAEPSGKRAAPRSPGRHRRRAARAARGRGHLSLTAA